MLLLKLLLIFYYPILITAMLVLMLPLYFFQRFIAFAKIQAKHPSLKAVLRDAWLSLIAFFCFLPASLICSYMYISHKGFIYSDIHLYGIPYFLFSLLLIMVVHDTYYYWLHRLLHTPFFFKRIHYVHHVSHNTTIMTFYAMHPLESALMAFSMPICAMLFPVSIQALTAGFVMHTLYTIYGHSGYEFMKNRFFSRFMNTSLSHNLHHQNVNVNYSYYFIFWDRVMGTLDPRYWQLFKNFFKPKAIATQPQTPS